MVRSEFSSQGAKFRRNSTDNFGDLRTEPSLESKFGMVQNDPRARHNTTIKMKKEKKNGIFRAFWVFLPILVIFGPFSYLKIAILAYLPFYQS